MSVLHTRKRFSPLVLIALFVTAAYAGGALNEALEHRIKLYWDALVNGDKAAALDFVTPETKNNFFGRQEPPMKTWKILQIEERGEDRAVVIVEVERMMPGLPGFHRTRFAENWLNRDGTWLVDVSKPLPPAQAFAVKGAKPKPLSGRVVLSPERVKVFFLNNRQSSSFRIINGLDVPVTIQSIEHDSSRFELGGDLGPIDSGAESEWTLSYLGDEIAKNLETHLTIRLTYEGHSEERELPVIYNYLSAGNRGIFGLTKEEAEKLTREDISKLKPVLGKPEFKKPPEKDGHPLPAPPPY